MSVNKSTYGIIGYDLSDMRSQLMTDEFYDSKEYEQFSFYKREGEIQMFIDPMLGEHLYFGYILFKTSDPYESNDKGLEISKIPEIANNVSKGLQRCFDIYIDYDPDIIMFNEYN